MALDVRDIFMVIRAKDQASRVINSVATSAMGDFTRVQRDARMKASQLGIDMAQMRTKYDRAILQSRERLFAAQRAGDADEARSAQERIKRLQMIRDAHALNIRQAQIDQRQQMMAVKQQHEATMAAVEHQRAVARTGGVMIAFGATMALVGGAGLKALHSMAMGAVEYQKQAALTKTQTDGIQVSVKQLQGISDSVAQSIGVPLETLQPALYDIFSSMNVNAKESQVLLTAFAKEAVAGQVSIQEASRATIGIMNAYHVPVSKVNDVLDFQFQLVRKGVGTFGQFANTIGRSIPSAVRAGQSYQTLGTMLAFLTRNGLSAAMASASAGRALDAFANPKVGRNFENLGKIITRASGLSAEQLRKLGIDTEHTSIKVKDAQGRFRNIVPVMGELSAVLMKLPPASRAAILQELFKGAGGTIQAMRFFSVAIPRFAELNGLLKDMGNDAGQAEKAYAEMAQTTAAETVRLSNNWKILKNSIGSEAMPALNDLLEWGNKFLITLHQLDPDQKKLIGNTVLWGSVATTAVGALIALSGAIVVLNAGVKTASLWFGTAKVGLVEYTAAAGGARAATIGLATQFGLLSAAILLAANAKTIDHKADEVGLSIHKKYVRPLYERLGLVDKNTSAMNAGVTTSIQYAGKTAIVTSETKKSSAALLGNYQALTAGQIAANMMAERGLKPAAVANRTLASSTRTARVETQKHVVDIKKVQTALRDALPDFRGMETQVKKTADEVDTQLRREISAYTNWSANIQKLIKRGVDPRFIQMLAKRGPEYVAAYANGSNRELSRGVRDWKRLHGAMTAASQLELGVRAPKGAETYRRKHAESVEAARRKHAEKMAAMEVRTRQAMIKAGESVAGFRSKANNELGNIHDEAVKVGATAQIQWSKDAATARFRAGRMAEGGRITVGTGPKADDVVVRASKGETIVSAAHSARPEFRAWASAMGIKGYADGGLIGRFSGSGLAEMRQRGNTMMADASAIYDRMATAQLMKIINKQKVPMGAFGGPLGGGSGMGWQWQMRVLRAAFPGLALISGYRPGAITSTGNRSYHALGRAVDVPPRWDVFNWIATHYGKNTKELIYTPAGIRQIKNGQHHVFTGGTIQRDHYSHIHWAMRNGGYITEPTLMYGMRTGRRGIVGEAGIEKVTPTRRETRPGLAAMGGSDQSGVNITINTQELVPEREAQMLGWHLQRRI